MAPGRHRTCHCLSMGMAAQGQADLAHGWEGKVSRAVQARKGVLSSPRLTWAGAEPHLGGQWGGRPAWSLQVASATAPGARAPGPGKCLAQP